MTYFMDGEEMAPESAEAPAAEGSEEEAAEEAAE